MDPNIQSALAQLQDIHTPTAIHNWPIAYGYWICLVLFILIIGGIVWLLKRKQQRNKIKHEALVVLEYFDKQSPQYSNDINSLLKRVVLQYVARTHIAKIDDAIWFTWLDQSLAADKQGQFAQLLGNRFAKPQHNPDTNEQLYQLTKCWLKGALPLTDKQLAKLTKELSC